MYQNCYSLILYGILVWNFCDTITHLHARLHTCKHENTIKHNRIHTIRTNIQKNIHKNIK